jgi:Protein of unknown function (DUF3631)
VVDGALMAARASAASNVRDRRAGAAALAQPLPSASERRQERRERQAGLAQPSSLDEPLPPPAQLFAALNGEPPHAPAGLRRPGAALEPARTQPLPAIRDEEALTGAVVSSSESTAEVLKRARAAMQARRGYDQLPSLLEVLDAARQYVGWAMTLHHVEDKDRVWFGLGSEEALTVASLWPFVSWGRRTCDEASHGHQAGVPGVPYWRALGRLGAFALTPGAGKTYLVERVLALCPNPSLEDEPTGPAMARMLGYEHGTYGIDEGDILVGKGSRKMMVKSLLNNGYKPGGKHRHATGSTSTAKMSTYGAVAVAAISTIETETGGDMKAFLERFFKLRLVKGPRGYRPLLIRSAEQARISTLAEHVGRVMMGRADEFSEAEVNGLPAFMSAREMEIWEPLYVVALAAGGAWPERVEAAADWYCNDGERRYRQALGWERVKEGLPGWQDSLSH